MSAASPKRALVTGGGRGIGKATARALATRGFEVIVADLDADAAAATAAEVGGSSIVLDVSDRLAVEAAAAEVGELDALINNAGIWRFAPILEAEPADIAEVLAVNLLGTLWCIRAFVEGLAARRGSIVNLSSLAAKTLASGVGSYTISKAGVEALSQQLARELGPRGIRVNAVGPGLVVTEGTEANYQGEAARQRAASVPLGRLGAAADIAEVVAWLASSDSSYVSGQVIYVDGALGAGTPNR
jgi:3-oxoacyl-[acyl-carrier protein] reductase